VDSERFNPSKRSSAFRGQFGIRQDGILVLYVGRLSQEKNLPLLLGIGGQLTRENPAVRLIVTGTGPMERKLKRAFSQAGIVFTGVRRGEELSTLFASADLFALPSSTETLSLVAMEAMASGIPVLAMNAGGVRDFLKHEENSLLANSDREFEEFLRLLAGDAGLRRRLGAGGRLGAEARTWSAAVAMLVRDYEKIAGTGNV
jgi:glycosyltransferase involved in cell wall biosynthesis